MWRVERFDEVASTNEEIKHALEMGQAEGLVCRARIQTGGYGRQGRSWSSPEGGSYQSLLLRPAVPAAQLPTLGLVVALAVREGLLSMGGLPTDAVQVKWPNDVVCAAGKLAGISLETHAGGVCAGVGVNVFRPRVEQPVGGKNTPAYFAELSPEAPGAGDRGRFVGRVGDGVLVALESRYARWKAAGFGPFAGEFQACDSLRGKRVRLVLAGGGVLVEGRAVGVDEAGCLLVDDGGRVRAVSSGEAHIV